MQEENDSDEEWNHEPVFEHFHVSTCSKISLYLLDSLYFFKYCHKCKGFADMKEFKNRIDQARKYKENDFDLRKIIKSIKQTKLRQKLDSRKIQR